MNTLNICTQSPKLASILQSVKPLTGFTHNFITADTLTNHDTPALIITSHLPAEFLPNAKYILCTSSPQALPAETLSHLYDLWPLPLTPSLIRYLFSVVQTRIQHETEHSAEHSEHQKRILEMARQDYLTGLATRWYLQDFIERNRHERNITCIYLDLDNFKGVNDTFGHQAGDRALAATAEMMQNEFPDGFSARMGGDEFMIVLLGKRDIHSIADRVNEFMTRLLKYYATTRTMRGLSVSAGISQSRPDAEKTIDQIIHEADRALYEAKKSGKAMCKVYSENME
ncbi:MAG: GGDEF domain-containing protein [Synergistaceae bacterium]|nr:GGDEF domain-containing protein [Synergistaceae bacterium]